MMKWKARTETTNIGVLELGNLTFNEDYMEVSIDICDMSDSLKADVEKAIEARKIKSAKEWEQVYKDHPEWEQRSRVFSDKQAVIDFTYLNIVLEADKPIKYSVVVGFHDAEDDRLEEDASITVDLSEHTDELKKAIIKVLIDKFF
ncbi:MAG: hypothetical protein K2N85_04245 [Lachnospiraceae bacterium]|nr:hypothetical protein [Lachnospiraceae bacterium]